MLIVDEAQHLDADLLEELRMLANLEAPGGRAVQVVLVGQPSLLETLRRPELAVLRQRIAVRAELSALSLEEAADYSAASFAFGRRPTGRPFCRRSGRTAGSRRWAYRVC